MLQVFLIDFFSDLIALLQSLFKEFDESLLNPQLLLEPNWMWSEHSLKCHLVNDVLN